MQVDKVLGSAGAGGAGVSARHGQVHGAPTRPRAALTLHPLLTINSNTTKKSPRRLDRRTKITR